MKTSQRGNVRLQQISTCSVCHGRGETIAEPCSECAESGKTIDEEKLSVRIPIGIEEGMRLRIPGKGRPGRQPGDRAGDLYIAIRTAADPRFERRGMDLWREQDLELVDAVLGTTLEVPTLEGYASVRIPPGTQPDSVLRLRDRGLPVLGGDSRGPLNLQLRVCIPLELSREERRLYERLRALSQRRPRRED